MKKGILSLLLAGMLFLLPACGKSASHREGDAQFEYLASSSGPTESILAEDALDTQNREETPTYGQSTDATENDAATGGSNEESKFAASSKIAVLPCFSFTQDFPLEMNYKSASFLIIDASVSDIIEEKNKIVFTLALTIQRQEDTLAGEKNFAVRIRWYDQFGNQIHTTTAATTAAAIGQNGYGSSTIAVDKINGDYRVVFEELQ